LTIWLAEDPSRMTFTTQSGYESETPQLRQRDKALTSLQKLWLKFGLTPHALAQLVKQKGCNIGNSLPAIAEFAKRKYAE
jgi:phage terminase small subunit